MGGGEMLAAALLLLDPDTRRRRTRAGRSADCCDEIPTRIRKGETDTITEKFCACAEAGAQVCDGRYASTYQLAHCSVLPTSPPIDLPEFPLQRSEPCRTQGNFEVGSVYEGRSRSPSPSSYRLRKVSPNRGSPHSPRPDKEGEAFASSLRKYPTAPERPPTLHDLQKLIKQAQKKYSPNGSPPSKSMRNVSEKSSPVSVHGNKSSKNLQTYTRSRNDSPKNEVKATKKARSGYTSPSPQCSKEIRANDTFDYLSSDVQPARGDRVRDSIGNSLRQVFGDPRGPVCRHVFCQQTVLPVCPKVLSRLEQHRREHHVCDESKSLRVDQAASGSAGIFPWSSNCGPPEASTSCSIEKLLVCCTCNDPAPCDCKPPICLCRELRPSEYELQERRRLQEIVCSWLDDLPVSAKEKPQDKFIRDALIRKLIDTLAAMNDEEFDAKGRDQIEKCINGMPMWYPHDKQEGDKFKKDLVDNLFDRIKGFRKTDRFKDVIAKWLDTIEFTEALNKDEVIDNFSNALKEIALNRPTNDGIYRDKLKTKIFDMLGALPVAATEDREGLVNLRAEQLADQLVRLPKSAVKPDSYFKSQSEGPHQLEKMAAYARKIADREFGAIILKALDEVDGLRELSLEKKETAIKEMLPKLPNLLTDDEDYAAAETYDQVHDFVVKLAGENGVRLDDRAKAKFVDKLVDNLEETFAHHLDIGESMSQFLTDLPKPPKPTVQTGQPGDQKQLDKPQLRGNSIYDPRHPKEESQRPGADRRGQTSRPQTDKRRLSGLTLLEDGRSPITTTIDGKRGTSPQRPTNKRKLSGQSYLEDEGDPTQPSTDGKRSLSPQRQTDKRRLSGQSLLEDGGSPTQRSTDGKRSLSPQRQTDKRRLSGQSYLEDGFSPTQRSTDGKRTPSPQRQTDKRRLSGQSYLEDEGSPTQRSTDGKRSPSLQRQTDKRRLSGQSYLEDKFSPTQRSTGINRSPSPQKQTDKRRLSGQSLLEDGGSPTQRSTDGKRSLSPQRQTDKRRLSGQSYLEDEFSPTQRSTDGKRTPSPQRQADKRRLSDQSYLEEKFSPTQRSTGINKSPSPQRQTDKRRLSGQSLLEDGGSPTQRSTDGKRSPSPQRQTDKHRLDGQSYLEDEVGPTQRSTDGRRSSSPQRQTDKRRLSGQSYLEEGSSPVSQRGVDGSSPSPQGQSNQRRLSGQSYIADGSPTTQRPGKGKSVSPQRSVSDERRTSDKYDDNTNLRTYNDTSPSQSYKRRTSANVKDEGSPTSQRFYGTSSPSKAYPGEKVPLTPSIIDIEYPSNLSKRGNIEGSQRPLGGGYGKPRTDQTQLDEAGFNSAPLGGKSLATDTGKRKSQPGVGTSNEVKAYSKDKGYLSDESVISNQRPVDAMGYLSDREEVKKFKDKGGIKSKALASKQGQGRDEPLLGRKNFYDTEARKQGMPPFDYEQNSQAYPESRRRNIDIAPGDNLRYLESDHHNKADSRRPSLLSGPTKVSQRNDGKDRQSNQTFGGSTFKSSGQEYVSGKPQSDDKRRASFNAGDEDDFNDQRSHRPAGTEVKPHMNEDGEKTVKRMKSFLGRYRMKVGLKKSPGLDEQEMGRRDDYDEGLRNISSDNLIDEPLDLSAERLKQPLARRRVSFTSDENLINLTDSDPMFQQSIRNNARDILDLTDANITNMSEVDLKLAELLEDLVMRGLDEDCAREQLFSVLGPEVSMEEAEEIFNALMGRAKELSAGTDPDMTSRFKTGPSATSTPRKDKRRQDEEDEFGNKLLTDKEREQERIRKQAESDYNEEMVKKIKSWMDDNNIFQSDAEKNSVARDLASDFVDRQKYLQLNPGAKTSSAEELEHMKYQVYKRINKLLDPEKVNAAISKVPQLMKRVKEVPVPQLTKGPLSAMSGCNDVVTKWCQKLPIPNTEQGMKTKQDMANNIMAKIGELNMNPQILNDDILYDDILGDFLDEQLNAIPGTDDKEQLKTELLEEVKKLRQPLQKKMAGQLYNEKLRDTIPKTLPPIDKGNKAEEASFEIMKDNLADAYINLHYVGGDSALREKFKNKINDEIDKYANDYLERHPNEPLSTSQLKKDLYSALKKVDVPGDESMRSEVERVRMKDLIDEWAKELPMKTQTPEQQLHTNKVLKAMTQRILDLERENQLNPTDDYDDKLEKEIGKYVKKLPVKDNANVSAQNKRLINKIKDTEHSRTFTEGSRRSVDFDDALSSGVSVEDRDHLQRIRDRISGLCHHCKSFIMQNSRSYVPPCRDAAVSPPPMDRGSQTDMTVKLNQYAQCKCSTIQIPPPATLPCPSRSRSHVSIPCNTPRPRVSTGSQVHVTPYILIDEYRWDTPTDQVTERPSHPCISSQSIPTCERRGTVTPEPCYTPPCRTKVTKLGSFNSSEYNRGLCTPPTRRNVVRDINDTQRQVPSTEPCHQHTPRKVWSRPHIYRDTASSCVSKEPVKCVCKGQAPNCSGRRPMVNCHIRKCHNNPLKACHKCCGAKCPHPTQLFFK